MSKLATSEGPSREPSHDAVWLAAQLRVERLTIVEGAHGAGKTALLQGLLPQLKRRASDSPGIGPTQTDRALDASAPVPDQQQVRSGTSGVVIPFPDRRRRRGFGSSPHDGEVVVFLDEWEQRSPLEVVLGIVRGSLQLPLSVARIDSHGLIEQLLEWHRVRGVRFLFVLDDFDACLRAATTHGGASEFIDFWVQALALAESPAHFVVSTSESAEPLWRLLTQHRVVTDELGQHRLELANLPIAQPLAKSLTRLSDIAATARSRNPSRGPLPDSDGDDDDAYVDADADRDSDFLTGLCEQDDEKTGSEREERPASSSSVAPRRIPSDSGVRTFRMFDRSMLAVTLAVLAVIIGSWSVTRITMQLLQGDPVSIALPSPISEGTAPEAILPAPLPLPVPGFELVADADDKSDAMIVSDMARLLTPRGSAAPRISFHSGWADELSSLAEKPRLSIVSYDVLQAARARAGGPALRVVAPLFSEEVYFLVRSDSPLRHIHETRAARFNVGPAAGSRALTTSGIYKRMFGTEPSPSALDRSSREDALDKLLVDRSIDVLMLVGAQPDPWLASLPESQRARLRLLELDAGNAASRKATATFLPVRVTPQQGSGIEGVDGTRTLGLMTFLVSSGADVAGADEQAALAAAAICRNLPGLQQSGHPKWREVHPLMQLETGWPVARAAADVFRDCQNPETPKRP